MRRTERFHVSWLAALSAGLIGLILPSGLRAEIEVTADIALGGGSVLYTDPAVVGDGQPYDTSRGVLRMGLNSSVIFLRRRNTDFGLGLYAEAMTSSFRDIQPGAGLAFVLPIHHGAPIIIFAGAHYDYDGAHAGGFGGRIWWGAHNHNHYRVYNSTFGIFFEVRGNVWGNQDVILAAGLDFDLHVAFTPWLWTGQWIRGPNRR